MKRILLTLLIACSALFVSAQTADEYFSKKDFDKAASAYIQILKADSTNVAALRRLAFCYLVSNTNEIQAGIYFEKALRLDPNDVASNYYLGVMAKNALKKDLTQQQRKSAINEAKRYFTKAASLGSDDAKSELLAMK